MLFDFAIMAEKIEVYPHPLIHPSVLQYGGMQLHLLVKNSVKTAKAIRDEALERYSKDSWRRSNFL